ncbi:zinc-binding alcohol dehydrogenase [Halovulum dunhuangense]|uniref:Zinc-binding alcohol dehydrogenase n=1 Tax=Halovulum dunhuangense TaxID=1505036 RepID=A0A849KZQ1_9RHOB|nr:zinc-binding alcohol dehydrogenase [Halovulum dunhuangense]NNU79454.1 zinc-binding alcohol dehydrogenase [Halovulum dunhuangense]
MHSAPALWITGPRQVEIRQTGLATGSDLIEVETLYTGISRGTERLVFEGRVPSEEQARMRAPFQEGDFPHPVKYGYCAVGRALSGAHAGQAVFVLHPHQARFAIPEQAAVPVPETVPPARAILAANMETALTILWDSGIGPGDRVTVIGTGVVGALAGWLAARIPGTEVTLVDVNRDRAKIAESLGCAYSTPDAAPTGCDAVIHTSASASGLATSIALAGLEATVVEASWHGSGTTPVPLGGAFHSKRLRIVGSQVGRIPPARAPRWDYRRRMEKALSLLGDPALDVLISGETAFDDLVQEYARILDDPATLCHRIRYPGSAT